MDDYRHLPPSLRPSKDTLKARAEAAKAFGLRGYSDELARAVMQPPLMADPESASSAIAKYLRLMQPDSGE